MRPRRNGERGKDFSYDRRFKVLFSPVVLLELRNRGCSIHPSAPYHCSSVGKTTRGRTSASWWKADLMLPPNPTAMCGLFNENRKTLMLVCVTPRQAWFFIVYGFPSLAEQWRTMYRGVTRDNVEAVLLRLKTLMLQAEMWCRLFLRFWCRLNKTVNRPINRFAASTASLRLDMTLQIW